MEAVSGVDGHVNESSYAPSGKDPAAEDERTNDEDENGG
jgi:hypothetical protein